MVARGLEVSDTTLTNVAISMTHQFRKHADFVDLATPEQQAAVTAFLASPTEFLQAPAAAVNAAMGRC